MVELFAVEIDFRSGFSVFERHIPRLSPERRQRISSYLREADGLRCMLSGLLAGYAASLKLGLDPFDIEFSRTRYGKPFLKAFPGFHFNVSHSGKWVVCAVGPDELGVDTEEIRPIDLSVAETVFASGELKLFNSLPEQDKLDFFYELWTLKESFMKKSGMGFYRDPRSFTVDFSAGIPRVGTEPGSKFRRYDLGDDFKTAVCSVAEDFVSDVRFVSCCDLAGGTV